MTEQPQALPSAQRRWLAAATLAALAYPAAGLLFGKLAGSTPAGATRTGWRLAAFAASGLVFFVHLRSENRRGSPSLRAAMHVALAVAGGALLLAAVGPVRSYGIQSRQGALSLLLWPIVTGVPAFLLAWLLATWTARRGGAGTMSATG